MEISLLFVALNGLDTLVNSVFKQTRIFNWADLQLNTTSISFYFYFSSLKILRVLKYCSWNDIYTHYAIVIWAIWTCCTFDKSKESHCQALIQSPQIPNEGIIISVNLFFTILKKLYEICFHSCKLNGISWSFQNLPNLQAYLFWYLEIMFDARMYDVDLVKWSGFRLSNYLVKNRPRTANQPCGKSIIHDDDDEPNTCMMMMMICPQVYHIAVIRYVYLAKMPSKKNVT